MHARLPITEHCIRRCTGKEVTLNTKLGPYDGAQLIYEFLSELLTRNGAVTTMCEK
jgi:hypothetical protein